MQRVSSQPWPSQQTYTSGEIQITSHNSPQISHCCTFGLWESRSSSISYSRSSWFYVSGGGVQPCCHSPPSLSWPRYSPIYWLIEGEYPGQPSIFSQREHGK